MPAGAQGQGCGLDVGPQSRGPDVQRGAEGCGSGVEDTFLFRDRQAREQRFQPLPPGWGDRQGPGIVPQQGQSQGVDRDWFIKVDEEAPVVRAASVQRCPDQSSFKTAQKVLLQTQPPEPIIDIIHAPQRFRHRLGQLVVDAAGNLLGKKAEVIAVWKVFQAVEGVQQGAVFCL